MAIIKCFFILFFNNIVNCSLDFYKIEQNEYLSCDGILFATLILIHIKLWEIKNAKNFSSDNDSGVFIYFMNLYLRYHVNCLEIYVDICNGTLDINIHFICYLTCLFVHISFVWDLIVHTSYCFLLINLTLKSLSHRM